MLRIYIWEIDHKGVRKWADDEKAKKAHEPVAAAPKVKKAPVKRVKKAIK
jgi:hypothetical protein